MSVARSRLKGVLHAIRETAQSFPDRPAILSGNVTISYSTLSDEGSSLACALVEDGVRPGDRVALILDNSPEFVLAYLAAIAAGATCVPLNPRAPGAAIEHVFEDCRPVAAFARRAALETFARVHRLVPEFRLVYTTDKAPAESTKGLTAAGMRDRLQMAPAGAPDIPPDQALALITYTSGTTGTPKGVMLSHANMAAIAEAGQQLVQLRESERIGALVPLFHLYGHREVDLALSFGATIVVPQDRNFLAAMLAEFHDTGVTGLSAVPSALAILLERHSRETALCLGSLRYLTIGTAPLPSRTLAALRETLPRTRLITTYGLTEASRVCWVDITDDARPVDPRVVGRPYPGVELQLIDETDGIGRVALKSGLVMEGYWQNTVATSRVLLADGTLLTPDCGRIADDGTLHLLGRIDDVINCGGQKVSPVEIEEVLAGHPLIEAVTVLGIADPDGLLGEVVQAVVVPKAGAALEAADVTAFAAQRLEPHKVPRYVELAKEIPRSVLGKASRSALRTAAASSQTAT